MCACTCEREQCKFSKIRLIARNLSVKQNRLLGINVTARVLLGKHPTLPSSSACAYLSLSKKDLDHANKEVKRVLAVENSGEWSG